MMGCASNRLPRRYKACPYRHKGCALRLAAGDWRRNAAHEMSVNRPWEKLIDTDVTTWQGLMTHRMHADLEAEHSSVPTDEGLAERITRLFSEHNESLVRFLSVRLHSVQEAKEVAQEAYVRLLSLDDSGAVSFLRAFLFKTAANLAVDRLRSRNRQRQALDAGAMTTIESSGGLSLGTAMPISGAAASPNMGYYTSAATGLFMTLFDVRLGWWMGNPRYPKK